jgi:hypothetical protein
MSALAFGAGFNYGSDKTTSDIFNLVMDEIDDNSMLIEETLCKEKNLSVAYDSIPKINLNKQVLDCNIATRDSLIKICMKAQSENATYIYILDKINESK